MILIVGLGNPSKKFEKTRHNLGFRVLDAFFKKNEEFYNLSNWKLDKKSNALISVGQIPTINNQKSKFKSQYSALILAKPQTFMNLSGKAVKSIIGNCRSLNASHSSSASSCYRKIRQLEIGNLIVVHDDIDLPLGKIKISKNRGAAGHKGVESIIRELKTKDFIRFRIGIGQFAQNQNPNEEGTKRGERRKRSSCQSSKIKNQKLDEFVLKNFSKEEKEIVREVVKKTVEAIEFSLKEGVEKAMGLYNC